MKDIIDVRFVGAPPSSIGKFGFRYRQLGMAPSYGRLQRFQGVYRRDGKPAPYSVDNIPLKPKHWLPVSLKDLNKGDFAMIMGYPGRTQRYATSYEVE